MPVAVHAIEPGVGMVRKIDHAVGDCPRASTVFMDSRPDVETLRRDILACEIPRNIAHHYVPAALLRTRFEPINFVAIEADLGKPDGLGHDQVRSDGRFPEAAGRGLHALRPLIRILSHYDSGG